MIQGNVSSCFPNYLKIGPQSEGFVDDIGGFIYIPKEGDYYPLAGFAKLYILRRDGVTYEFEEFKISNIGADFYIYDYKLIAVYGNTYDPSLRNKISYYYEGSGTNTKLDSIKTSSDKIIKFHYSQGVVDLIILPDGTAYHYEYATQGGNKAINKVTDPIGRVTQYFYHPYELGIYFKVDSIKSWTGLTKIFRYSSNEKFFVDTIIRNDYQFSHSDTIVYAVDTISGGTVLKKTETLNGTQTNVFFTKKTYCSSQDRDLYYLIKQIDPLNDSTLYFYFFDTQYELTYWGKANVLDSVRVFKRGLSYKETYDHITDDGLYFLGSTPDPFKDISALGDTNEYLFTYQWNDFFSYGNDSMDYFLDTCLTTNNNLPLVDSIPRYFSNQRKIIYPNGSVWKNEYNDTLYNNHTEGHGFLIKKRHFVGDAFSEVYDSLSYGGYGNVIYSKDALGGITTYDYNDIRDYNGYNNTFATKIVDAAGNTSYFDYDTLTGRLKRTKDANGNITEYKYDNIGRILKLIKPGDSELSPTVKYYYDDSNNKVYITTKRGNGDTIRVCSTYDAFGNIRTKEINGVIVNSFYYDNFNRLVKQVDAEGRTTWYRYDLLNRIITTILPDSTPSDTTDNPVMQYSYSSENYQLPLHSGTYIFVDKKLVTDPEGNKTMYITDALGQLRETRKYIPTGHYSDANGNYERVLYDYDSMGNLTKVQDERRLDNTYSYDDKSQLKLSNDFDRGISMNVYDAMGRLRFSRSSKDTSDNRWVYNKYDQLSRLVEKGTIINPDTTKANAVSYPSSQDIEKCYVKMLYDEKSNANNPVPAPARFYSSNPNLKGRLSAIFYSNSGDSTNYDAVECYEYDSRGRLKHKGVRLLVDGSPKWYEIRYEYDSADNLSAIIYPDGSRVTYKYNSQNRLSEVSDGANISYNTFTYDASGLDTLENYGNNGKSIFKYNARALLKSINVKMPAFGSRLSDVFIRTYEYDRVGNLTYEKKDLTTYAYYEYDELYRLTKEQYPQESNWQMTYTYDRAGNRLSAGATGYTIDSNSNRLLSQGANYYYYDEDGDMDSLVSGSSITTLNYNFADRLKQVNEPEGDTTKYYYDGNGLRIRKRYRKNEFTPGGENLKGVDTDTGFVATGEAGSPSYTITERYYIHSGPGMVLVQDDNTPNILTNPGFEDGSTGWGVYVPGEYGDNWKIENNKPYAGSYSLKSESYDLSTYESYYQKFYLSAINLKTPFILSAYVKTSNVTGKGAQLLVQYEAGDSTFLVYGSEYITGTTVWHEVDLVVDSIPQEAERVCVTLRRYRGDGTVYFDAV
ncbi:MAG: hypothetical protein B5M53_02765, partial [Candidatus Cloacimonas sp. 4484_209]